MKSGTLWIALALYGLILAMGVIVATAQDPEACVRVHAGNSIGSGTVFYRSQNGDAFILTNHHVAGRKGSRVTIDFWDDGQLKPAIPGVVVEARIDQGWTDVAIVRVDKDDLGTLNPPYIPLAAPATHIDGNVLICSRGCPGGVWQCQFYGRTKAANESRMEFYPRPGGGRSGSSVLVAGKNEIAGLLTWSASKPNWEDHGTDGSSPKSGFGIAQQVDSVWRVIRGQASLPTDDRPEHMLPLACADKPSLQFSFLSLQAEGRDQGIDQTQLFRRRPWRRPHNPRDMTPGYPNEPEPMPELAPPLIEPDPLPDPFGETIPENELSPPRAEPEVLPPADPPHDQDGLLSRRFGPPAQPPQAPPPSEDRFSLRQPGQSVGPFRQTIADVKGLFRLLIYGLAAVGAFSIYRWFRTVKIVKAVTPLLLACAIAPQAFAQQPSAAYVNELENRAQRWQAEPTSYTDRWGSYSAAMKAAAQDQKPLLVLLTMPGCSACTALKEDLERADRHGLLEDVHTCMVDLAVQETLAKQFKPEAYPTLVAYTWDEKTKKHRQASRHTGAFRTRLDHVEEQKDGSLEIHLAAESLDEWLKDSGVK